MPYIQLIKMTRATVMLLCYCFTFGLIFTRGSSDERKFVDLSHSFSNKTQYWPGARNFSLVNVVRGRQNPGGYWIELNEYRANEHGGTHMDAPCHFAEGQWSIDEIPIERMISPAVVIDISKRAETNPDAELVVEDLKGWEKRYGPIPDGAVVFMFSNWAVRFTDRYRYFGGYGTDLHFPGFSIEAAIWLTDNRNIHAMGVDGPSIDPGHRSNAFPVHTHICRANMYALEHVNNLDKLPAQGATVFAFPMKIEAGSGAPCRIIAQLPSDAKPVSKQHDDL